MLVAIVQIGRDCVWAFTENAVTDFFTDFVYELHPK